VLLRFEVSNHRSIAHPVELSMIAVDADRPATRSFDLINESVLTISGIYGANASGKSNVLESMVWLSRLVRTSLRELSDGIPRQPFRFANWPSKDSTFEIEMVINGVRYTYRLEVDDSTVLFEGLYSYPEKRRRSLFERQGSELTFRRGLGHLSGARELLTPSTLALSAVMRFKDPDVSPLGRSLTNIGVLVPGRGRTRPVADARFWRRHATEWIFLERSNNAQEALFDPPEFGGPASPRAALDLLRFADLGIADVEIVERTTEDGEMRRFLRLVHEVAGQRVAFGMSDESEGTRTWFAIIGPVLEALRSGHVLLFDEIDASLHPRLSAKLIELFQDPVINPSGAQLIFTSHDTSLLNHLNRDEVWLTEKGNDGATTLTALADYGGDKVRRSLNLERAYLQGRFGAVPELDQSLLLGALGTPSEEG
jgi:uncharacterized protein